MEVLSLDAPNGLDFIRLRRCNTISCGICGIRYRCEQFPLKCRVTPLAYCCDQENARDDEGLAHDTMMS